jgi:hypothetical protein
MTNELAQALGHLNPPKYKEGEEKVEVKKGPSTTQKVLSGVALAGALHGAPQAEAISPLEIDRAARESLRPGTPAEAVELIEQKYEKPGLKTTPQESKISKLSTAQEPLSDVLENKERQQEQRDIFKLPIFELSPEGITALRWEGLPAEETKFASLRYTITEEDGVIGFAEAEKIFANDSEDAEVMSKVLGQNGVREILGKLAEHQNLFIQFGVDGNKTVFSLQVGEFDAQGNFREVKYFGANEKGVGELPVLEGEKEVAVVITDPNDPHITLLAARGIQIQVGDAFFIGTKPLPDKPNSYEIKSILVVDNITGRVIAKRVVVGDEQPPADLAARIAEGEVEILPTPEPMVFEARLGPGLAENQNEINLTEYNGTPWPDENMRIGLEDTIQYTVNGDLTGGQLTIISPDGSQRNFEVRSNGAHDQIRTEDKGKNKRISVIGAFAGILGTRTIQNVETINPATGEKVDILSFEQIEVIDFKMSVNVDGKQTDIILTVPAEQIYAAEAGETPVPKDTKEELAKLQPGVKIAIDLTIPNEPWETYLANTVIPIAPQRDQSIRQFFALENLFKSQSSMADLQALSTNSTNGTVFAGPTHGITRMGYAATASTTPNLKVVSNQPGNLSNAAEQFRPVSRSRRGAPRNI